VRCDLVDGASDNERIFRRSGKEESNDSIVVGCYEEGEIVCSEAGEG
jgi:hypothetical protein